ncbi:hypothetical protein [uncultured Hymenobacter sp.]|uniref:hypothetical protein n=1 Tax=uncultured Hymenobacter sp. TaxID=170016 RepID=UPI0035CBC758
MTGLRTSLMDAVAQLPDGQIAWATHWQLCWQPYSGAQTYELQVTTDEGTSPKLRRRMAPCYRLQVAAGQNAQSQGLRNRQQLLAVAQAGSSRSRCGPCWGRGRSASGRRRACYWSRPKSRPVGRVRDC